MTQSITGSVGEGGTNHPLDVATVQALLFWIPPALGGPGAEDGDTFVDARIGPTTIGAIRTFQQTQFKFNDGLLAPSDFGIRRLNAVVDKLAEGQLGPVANPISIKAWALRRARTQDATIVDLGAQLSVEPMLFGFGLRSTFENGIISTIKGWAPLRFTAANWKSTTRVLATSWTKTSATRSRTSAGGRPCRAVWSAISSSARSTRSFRRMEPRWSAMFCCRSNEPQAIPRTEPAAVAGGSQPREVGDD
jgi:hypothetical protein